MQTDELRTELDSRFAQSGAVIAYFTVAILAITALRDVFVLSDDHPQMAPMGITMLVLAILLAALQVVVKPTLWPYLISTALIFLIVIRNLLSLYVVGDASYAVTTSFLLIIYSIFALSYRWMVITCVSTAIAWSIVTLTTLEGRETAGAGIVFVGAVVCSFLIVRNRIRFHTRGIMLEQRVRQLESMLPLCANCRKIRNAENEWVSLEAYADESLHKSVTHGICPSCALELYPEIDLPVEELT